MIYEGVESSIDDDDDDEAEASPNAQDASSADYLLLNDDYLIDEDFAKLADEKNMMSALFDEIDHSVSIAAHQPISAEIAYTTSSTCMFGEKRKKSRSGPPTPTRSRPSETTTTTSDHAATSAHNSLVHALDLCQIEQRDDAENEVDGGSSLSSDLDEDTTATTVLDNTKLAPRMEPLVISEPSQAARNEEDTSAQSSTLSPTWSEASSSHRHHKADNCEDMAAACPRDSTHAHAQNQFKNSNSNDPSTIIIHESSSSSTNDFVYPLEVFGMSEPEQTDTRPKRVSEVSRDDDNDDSIEVVSGLLCDLNASNVTKDANEARTLENRPLTCSSSSSSSSSAGSSSPGAITEEFYLKVRREREAQQAQAELERIRLQEILDICMAYQMKASEKTSLCVLTDEPGSVSASSSGSSCRSNRPVVVKGPSWSGRDRLDLSSLPTLTSVLSQSSSGHSIAKHTPSRNVHSLHQSIDHQVFGSFAFYRFLSEIARFLTNM